MKMMKTCAARIMFAGSMFVLLATPSLAYEPEDVLARLEAVLHDSRFTIEGGNLKAEGNAIVVEGVQVGVDGNDETQRLNMRLDDIVDNGNGSFTVGRFSTDDFHISFDGNDRLDLEGFEIEQLYLPSPDEPRAHEIGYQPYRRLKINNFFISQDRKKIVGGEETFIEVGDFTVGKRLQYKLDVSRFAFDVDAFGSDFTAILKDFGYESLSGKISSVSTVDLESSVIAVNNLSFDFENIGVFSIGFQLSGYTPEIAESVQMLQDKVDNPQALGLGFLGIAQELKFDQASIRFEDASLTGKVLDFVAANTVGGGASGKDIVPMAVMVVQSSLTELDLANVAVAVSQAVGTYLKDPKSIEMTAAPLQPVSLLALAGAQDPKVLVEMLNVQVKANQ